MTQEQTKIKFPSGRIGNAIHHYMGFSDPSYHLLERPAIVQQMYKDNKCRLGKIDDYSQEEIQQLIDELVNAVDIKQDHVEDYKGSEWTSLNQHQLVAFLNKLKTANP